MLSVMLQDMAFMLSPIGRNAYFCCSRYSVYVRRVQSLDVILTVRCLLELLYVRHGYSSLSLFTRDKLVYAISPLSTGYMCIVLCTLCTIFTTT